jgi:hypothetical protein
MTQGSESNDIKSKLYGAIAAVAVATFVIGLVVGYIIWGV